MERIVIGGYYKAILARRDHYRGIYETLSSDHLASYRY